MFDRRYFHLVPQTSMNYLRGAVNAISAPYQYYKDINPSTLTGAIDVIVVESPADDGGTTLSCSPFHVRFGKLQVLRPSDKKVNVLVNGHSIPFAMKIGDAGEAFFVFETDDDIPADLVTSPLLLPTDENVEENEEPGEVIDSDILGPAPLSSPSHPIEIEESHPKPGAGEPTFLDLNDTANEYSDDVPLTARPPPTARPPTARPHITRFQDGLDPNIDQEEQDRRVDEALRLSRAQYHIAEHEPLFTPGVVLDTEGYHSCRHGKEESEETVTDYTHTSEEDSIPFPILRASSEPPPDEESHIRPGASEFHFDRPETPTQPKGLNLTLPVQEYSWEWGAFPQPSPIQATFSGGVLKGRDLLPSTWSKAARRKELSIGMNPLLEHQDDMQHLSTRLNFAGGEHHRSLSVPPDTEMVQRDFGDRSERKTESPSSLGYGAGGTLVACKSDPTIFVLKIEGKRTTFELSVVDFQTEVQVQQLFNGRDEVEASRSFAQGQVQFTQFLEDDKTINHPGLVIRWSGDHYITRQDNSPLMGALLLWWKTAQTLSVESPRSDSEASRPASPLSDDEDSSAMDADTTPPTSGDEGDTQLFDPLAEAKLFKAKPTSSSWVKWWSRSHNVSTSNPALSDFRATSEPIIDKHGKSATSTSRSIEIVPAESAPALPSTPVDLAPPTLPEPATSEEEPHLRRFAKTLRLTSDQLKMLNLHKGANTITFSLASTGVIACTARIFVWGSTDLICISDIDGTITKSDGLGHVFAMIGRDWTHMGVAKLYTDITRNGYKILYLTSRAIGQADATRGYLKGIKQNNYQLPEGPVIMSPDRLMVSLHREVVLRKPEVFKMACLRDIQRLFGQGKGPFCAGFGNRITDALSYRSVNVPSSRIFTIDSTGEVKLELLELAGYKSSYIHMTDLVDQMFPPIHRKWAPEYTDFNYWKQPVQEFSLPDLSPPSPALSAHSDVSTSTLARLRNFSLVGSSRASPDPEDISGTSPTWSIASSFRRPTSPSSLSSSSRYNESDDENYLEDMDAEQNRRYHRQRVTSISSIATSSLHDLHESMEDEELELEGSLHPLEDFDDIQDTDDTFDEDLLAAGEMKNVPFL